MKKQNAFTLIELLVVISIIALLVAILMPALNAARQQATGSVCLSNQKALILAWTMYAQENNDNLVGGTVSGYKNGDYFDWPGTKAAWAYTPTDLNGFQATTANVNQDLREYGIFLGKLWKYTQSYEVYNCPGDKNFKRPTPKDTYRTYSISGMMNGEDANPGHNARKAYTRLSQIKSPIEKMVFIEEYHPEQNWLAGSWVLHVVLPDYITDSYWWDIMAIWHNKKGTMSFADGHAEMMNWTDPRTIELSTLPTKPATSSNDQWSKDNKDLQFLSRAYGGV